MEKIQEEIKKMAEKHNLAIEQWLVSKGVTKENASEYKLESRGGIFSEGKVKTTYTLKKGENIVDTFKTIFTVGLVE